MINQDVTVHTDFEQGSDDWHRIRRGKIGGTSCSVLFTLPSKKDQSDGEILGKGARDLAYKIASQRLGLHGKDNPYAYLKPVSEAMERGVHLEPFARRHYERETTQEVYEVGYVSHDLYDVAGFSPDGVVVLSEDEIGLVEIKCPMGPEFLRVLTTGVVKKEYIQQMQWGMWITGADWCDHFTWFPDSDKYSSIRFERDREMMGRLDIAVPALQAMVDSALEAAGGKK